MGRGTGGRAALIILLSEATPFVDGRHEDAVHAVRSETQIAEEIRRLAGPRSRTDWGITATRHAIAVENFVEAWTAQLEDYPEQWDSIAEDYNADKVRLADSRRALLALLRGKQAKTMIASRPRRRIPGVVVVPAVAAVGLAVGALLVQQSGHASPTAQARIATGTAAATPRSSGSVTGISVSISGGRGGAQLDAQVHVDTRETGPVTVTVTIAGSATNGRPGGDHADSTSRTLSGATAYDFTASVSGSDYCADYYVGALAAGGGRSAYNDQATGC